MNIIKKYGYPLCEAGGLALWAVLAAGVFPGAGIAAALMLAGIWIFVRIAAALLGVDTKAEKGVLLGAMVLVGALLIVNLDFFMSHPGARDGEPYLANFDAANYWGLIRGNIERGPIAPTNTSNYSILMSPVAAAAGFRGVLSFNTLCVMLTICFCGRIARECCRKDGGRVSAAAMLMLTLAFNFLALGTVLLKDAVVGMAFSGIATALLLLRDSGKIRLWPLLGSSVGCLLSIWVRPLSGVMIIALILLLAPWKDIAAGKNRTAAAIFPALTILCAAIFLVVNHVMIMSVPDLAKENLTVHQAFVFEASPRGSSLSPLINAYPSMPVWQRLALLPFTMGLQLFLPLPWTYLRHFDYGPTMMLSHMGYPFYIEAGLILYFFFFALRKAPRLLVLTTSAGAVFYALTAYIYGGTVSRYVQMFVPLLIPAGAWVLLNCRRERRLKLWMAAYMLILALILGAGMYVYNLNPGGNDLRC